MIPVVPGQLAKSHRFDLLHHGNRGSEKGDNREGFGFHINSLGALTWNYGNPMLIHQYFVYLKFIYVMLKGGTYEAHSVRKVFFVLGLDTITDICFVREAVSPRFPPVRLFHPTSNEPGSCLLVSAGSGVHLLDLETKSSSDGMGWDWGSGSSGSRLPGDP